MTVPFDPLEIQKDVYEILRSDDDLRSYTSSIKEGDYELKSIHGIDVWVKSGATVESNESKVLFGSTYETPVEINLLCRYRTRDNHSEDMAKAVNVISNLLHNNHKPSSTNGYKQPIEISDSFLGQNDTPEAFIYTITITYETLVIST